MPYFGCFTVFCCLMPLNGTIIYLCRLRHSHSALCYRILILIYNRMVVLTTLGWKPSSIWHGKLSHSFQSCNKMQKIKGKKWRQCEAAQHFLTRFKGIGIVIFSLKIFYMWWVALFALFCLEECNQVAHRFKALNYLMYFVFFSTFLFRFLPSSFYSCSSFSHAEQITSGNTFITLVLSNDHSEVIWKRPRTQKVNEPNLHISQWQWTWRKRDHFAWTEMTRFKFQLQTPESSCKPK